MEGVRLRTVEMSPEDRQFIINSSIEQHQLREVIDTINNNKDIDQETKALMINNEAAKIQEIESERERIFSQYGSKERSKQATQKAEQLFQDSGQDVDVISSASEAEFAKALEEDGLNAKEAKQRAEESFGIYQGNPDPKTGRRKIFLNEEAIS